MSEAMFSDTIDRLKESFLWAAAQGGNAEDCEQLIAIGADVNWRNLDGDTPLLAACRRGHSGTVALLLAHGADSNLCGADSLAPVHICAKRGDGDSMNALLEANTATGAKTKEGLTALDIAQAKGHTDIYSALMGTRGRIAARPLAPLSTETAQLLATVGPSGASPATIPPIPRRSASKENAAPLLSVPANRLPPSSTINPAPLNSNSLSNVQQPFVTKKSTLAESQSAKRVGSTSVSSSSGKEGQSAAAPSYTIAGQQAGSYTGDDPALVSLRVALEREEARRKAVEAKLEIFRDQNSQLLKELTALNSQFNELQEDQSEAEAQLHRLLGRPHAIEAIASIEDCEELERTLKNSLEIVEEKKAALIRDQIGSQKEQRLCVICQEKEKSVVLLPCRHLCLCAECCEHAQLKLCPLCRQQIESKFVVFS